MILTPEQVKRVDEILRAHVDRLLAFEDAVMALTEMGIAWFAAFAMVWWTAAKEYIAA